MIRINADRIIATMQNLHIAVSNWTIHKFPSNPVRSVHFTESPEAAVSIFEFSSRPKNASVRCL